MRIQIDGLPLDCRTAQLFRWLLDGGGVAKDKIGRIHIDGRFASVEVDDSVTARMARGLAGTRFNEHEVDIWYEGENEDAAQRKHFKHLRGCVDAEARAEAKAIAALAAETDTTQRDSAAALTRMRIVDQETSIGGERLTFSKRSQHENLPWVEFRPGSPVLLLQQNRSDMTWRGTVKRLQAQTVEIVVAGATVNEMDSDAYFSLHLAHSEVTRVREQRALARGLGCQEGRLAELRSVLLGTAATFSAPAAPTSENGLNDSQAAAVKFARSANELAIIHGPPGTGKTTSVAAFIQEAVANGERVLACAPSNMAVDNIVLRLQALAVPALRLGNPARIAESLHAATIEAQAAKHSQANDLRGWHREANRLRGQLRGLSSRDRDARDSLRTQLRALNHDIQQLQAQVRRDILHQHPVHCATLTHVDAYAVGCSHYDWLVIDEVCQATETACWIPLPHATRILLAGDHQQLPPTVLSPDAVSRGYGVSLMERLMAEHDNVACQLTTQYRMHRDIMGFSSNEFYDGSLIADATVAERTLVDLPDVEDTEFTTTAIQFIDTSGADFAEESDDSGSKCNADEAKLVVQLVELALEAGVGPEMLFVVSPYAAQVQLLQTRLMEHGVAVSTIDGCQGRENELVIISLVRSNVDREIGFLEDTRRMNVAMTRARRKLIVVGDSATLAGHPFYDRFLDHVDGLGAYHTVWEYV